jgi:excisionase family DNA binding protein
MSELLIKVNIDLLLGSFDLHINSSIAVYRTSIILGNSDLEDDITEHLLYVNWCAMDTYFPAINMVLFGNMSPKQAIEKVRKRRSSQPDSPDEADTDVSNRLGDILGGLINRQLQAKVKAPISDNRNGQNSTDTDGCSVCRDLLANLGRFLEMLETARNSERSDWLTVDEVAKELRISKTEVCRLIHYGQLEAINIVGSNGRVPQRGRPNVPPTLLQSFAVYKGPLLFQLCSRPFS